MNYVKPRQWKLIFTKWRFVSYWTLKRFSQEQFLSTRPYRHLANQSVKRNVIKRIKKTVWLRKIPRDSYDIFAINWKHTLILITFKNQSINFVLLLRFTKYDIDRSKWRKNFKNAEYTFYIYYKKWWESKSWFNQNLP